MGKLVRVITLMMCIALLCTVNAQAADCVAQATPECSINGMNVPAYKGWANAPPTTTTTWHWTGSSWTQRSLNANEKVYAQYFASGWTWTWTPRLGWTATSSNKVSVPVTNLFYSTSAYSRPYVEVGEPTGAWLNKPARGVMLVIHGGGLFGDNPSAVIARRPTANRWRERGWLTVNIDYRTGVPSLMDVPGFYDTIRAATLSGAKVCATGDSAGAYLSLMLAVHRPSLACAISMAGVADFSTLPFFVRSTIAVASLSDAELRNISPLPVISKIQARVLLAVGSNDAFTPPDQHAALVRARPDFQSMVLATPGPIPFVHTYITVDEWNRYLNAELAFSESVLNQ